MIAWCGSRSDGLGWLHERSASIGDIVTQPAIDTSAIDDVCSQHPQRLVVAVDSRVEYPLQTIEHLAHTWPEIPWALAMSSWHDGARRTGVGSTSHLSLPWYRWWDGWSQWLNGSETQLLGHWPRLAAALSTGFQAERSIATLGVIIGNCRETALGWQHSLITPRASSDLVYPNGATQLPLHLSTRQLSAWFAAPTFAPAWFLWDDTSLDTFDLDRSYRAPPECFSELKSRFPDALVIAATSMPRWSDWQVWRAAGADELIVKPSFGLPLAAVLGNS